MQELKYLTNYSKELQAQVNTLIAKNKLEEYLTNKYTTMHQHTTDKALYSYVMELKNSFMKKSAPLSKVEYNSKIRIENALGTHTFISRKQGSRLKAKNEIAIASMFKSLPIDFLNMIIVHELAHFKYKEHNKNFYQLCIHMEPSYAQLEFDLRLYLTQVEVFGKIERWS